MPHLQLQPHVSLAILGDGAAIFLDLRRDRYFALSGAAASAFDRLRFDPPDEVDEPAASALLATGLFAETAAPESPGPGRIPPASRELRDSLESGSAPTDVPEIWCLLSRARRALRSRPLADVVDAARRRSRQSSPSETERVAALANRFRRARAWIPVHPSCLQDSLALHEWLARRRAPAALVLGVKLHPFAAHCWLQLGPTVLNDRLETIAAFTPILAVGCG